MAQSLQSPRRTSHASVEVDELPDFKKVRAGQPEAWEIGFKVLWGVGHSVCNSALRNFQGVDSDLIISDAINDVISKARDVASWDELKALTARVVRWRAIDAIRRQKSQKHGGGRLGSLEDLQIEPAAPAYRRPDEDLYHAELWRAYRECTRQLAPRAQEIVELRLVEQMTQKEISEKLAIPQGTVGVTIMKTLESIRSCLQARGFNPGDKSP
jgi:RNA polymerase sigma factor (sigma-70 family)